MDKQWPNEPPADYLRLPGLLRRWEIEQALTAGHNYYIEESGSTSDGVQLYAVYQQERGEKNE